MYYSIQIIYSLLFILVAYGLYKLVTVFRNIVYFISLPGPPVDYLLRHEIDSFRGSADVKFAFQRKYNAIFPKLCRYFIGPLPLVHVSHPETIKIIINSKPPKHPLYNIIIGDWIGDGLLLSNGAKWNKHRKLLTPAFHYQILERFFSIYNSAIQVLHTLWDEQLQANIQQPIVLQDYMSYFSLDILLQCVGSLRTEIQLIREDMKYVRDVHVMTHLGEIRSSNALYYVDFIFYKTEIGRKFKAACKSAQAFTKKIILERKEALSSEPNLNCHKTRDFLDILLTSHDERGVGLSDDEICNEVDTFVFEGHDTTATALLWVFYYIALHSDYQSMCRNEVMSISSSSDLNRADIDKCEFLHMFIKESLRLRPPVHSIIRQLHESLRIDGHFIPKGTMLLISIYSLHLNKQFWVNPHTFNPFRFSKENLDSIDPYSYLPFSAGNRNCIGQQLALHEIAITLASSLRKYKFELDSSLVDKEIEMERDVLFKPSTQIKLHISYL